MTSTAPVTTENHPLFFQSLNPSEAHTILLIHGAFSSHHELLPTSAHLSSYHVLLPNLHFTGASNTSPPRHMSLTTDTAHLAALLRKHAASGTAHIVGCSMGSHFALELATDHSDVVQSVFISGWGYLARGEKPRWVESLMPAAVALEQRIENAVPRRLVRWLMDGKDAGGGEGMAATTQMATEVLDVVGRGRGWTQRPVGKRVLVCAAGKSGILPTADSVEKAMMLRNWLQGEMGGPDSQGSQPGCSATQAVLIPTVRHPWWVTDPDLFARSVVAWIEDKALPREMVVLE